MSQGRLAPSFKSAKMCPDSRKRWNLKKEEPKVAASKGSAVVGRVQLHSLADTTGVVRISNINEFELELVVEVGVSIDGMVKQQEKKRMVTDLGLRNGHGHLETAARRCPRAHGKGRGGVAADARVVRRDRSLSAPHIIVSHGHVVLRLAIGCNLPNACNSGRYLDQRELGISRFCLGRRDHGCGR